MEYPTRITIECRELDELKAKLEIVGNRLESLLNAVSDAERTQIRIQTKINQPTVKTDD